MIDPLQTMMRLQRQVAAAISMIESGAPMIDDPKCRLTDCDFIIGDFKIVDMKKERDEIARVTAADWHYLVNDFHRQQRMDVSPK